jgi:hypothetical protein
MKQIYWMVFFSWCSMTLLSAQTLAEEWSYAAVSMHTSKKAAPAFRWPWQVQRQSYFTWWSDKVTIRMIESFKARPAVRYLHRKSNLSYLADETIFGGEIVIDDDLLNAVDLPNAIERRLEDLRVELPMGDLVREARSWTSMAQFELSMLGITARTSYWSGALSPGQFPQPLDINVLFNSEKLINVAAREIAATSALNNAVSLEILVHPLMLLTGLRQLEWNSESGIYLNGDLAWGWVKATDLTFKQGRELLGDVDFGQTIRDAIPDPLEELINTDEAARLILDAAESRLPLYGFGLPVASGRTFEIAGKIGYRWANNTWTGDASVGLFYQTQHLSNEHPSNPVLKIRRIAPTLNVKWIFNKRATGSSLL